MGPLMDMISHRGVRPLPALNRPARTSHGFDLLSRKARVLIELSADPSAPMRRIAVNCGMTERSVVTIIGDLEAAGVVERTRRGRTNSYALRIDERLARVSGAGATVADFLAAFSLPQSN